MYTKQDNKVIELVGNNEIENKRKLGDFCENLRKNEARDKIFRRAKEIKHLTKI